MAVAVARGGVDGAGEFDMIGPSQGPNDGGGVSRAFADVGGEMGLMFGVVDDKVEDAVVVVDKPVGRFIQYCPLSIELLLDLVNCFGIEVGLVEEVSATCFCSVSESNSDVFGVLEGERWGRKGGESCAWG